MKPIVIIFSMLGALFLIFVVRLLSLTSAGPSMVTAPWWVYITYLAILFSGIMYVYSWLEDKRNEQRVIEEEGKKILSLYEKNREKVNNGQDSNHTDGVDEEWKRYSL